MTYYLLPKTNAHVYEDIDCIFSTHAIEPYISSSLAHYLYEIKIKIEEREYDWDLYKKYTNPYEYVHGLVPNKKKSVSKYKPLSRSYFKMLEIMQTFNIRHENSPIKTFHLAEGPGGFIEAVANTRNNKDDVYIGMSLLDDKNDPNIPGWKKTENFLRHNKNVYIERGKDGTGDILSIENFIECKNKYASSMSIVTGDGGFDFSIDFNKQEMNISKLLFAQVCYALILQKRGGCFVLKIFDCFMKQSVDILHILTSFYDKVYIIKPNSSRYANSEKYIVCKGFLHSSIKTYYNFLHNAFEKMLSVTETNCIHRFLNTPISNYFITKLEEYNAIFGQQQIENIHHTIALIDNNNTDDKIDNMVKTNIQKAIQWCNKFNVPCNAMFSSFSDNAIVK